LRLVILYTHTGLLILQPDGWIEQTRFKKIKTKIKIANMLANLKYLDYKG